MLWWAHRFQMPEKNRIFWECCEAKNDPSTFRFEILTFCVPFLKRLFFWCKQKSLKTAKTRRIFLSLSRLLFHSISSCFEDEQMSLESHFYNHFSYFVMILQLFTFHNKNTLIRLQKWPYKIMAPFCKWGFATKYVTLRSVLTSVIWANR